MFNGVVSLRSMLANCYTLSLYITVHYRNTHSGEIARQIIIILLFFSVSSQQRAIFSTSVRVYTSERGDTNAFNFQ